MYAFGVTHIIILGHTLFQKTKELYIVVTHTNLRITIVCINIYKHPLKPCRLYLELVVLVHQLPFTKFSW